MVTGEISDVLRQVFENLTKLGLVDLFLPFILIFTIMFAILQKAKILGTVDDDGKTPKRNFNAVIALCIALLVVMPHIVIPGRTIEYGSDNPALQNGWPDVVVIINKALPQVSLLAVAIVMMMLLVGILGPNIKFGGASLTGVIALISIIAIIIIFGASSGLLGERLVELIKAIGPEWLSVIVIILIFGLVIYFITKEPDKPGQKGWMQALGEQFKQ